MSSISFKNLKKVYPGNVVAVQDFNFEIKDKEFIILVGPSGCGKSTVLRMIAGLEEISDGELYIDGKYINDVAPKDRDIAMVFQNYALYPHMTVFKNMAFGLELRKLPKVEIRQKVEEAATILQIGNLLERKPKALSGGQRQRVALGRAMVRNPKVFLLDEPLSNLDAKLRTEMRAEIIKLHKEIGTTFIYVTHDQMEAMTMGDRIVIMKDGLIHQADTPLNLYNNPCNTYVAGFIGSPQMNFADAYMVRNGSEICLDLDGHILPIPKHKIPQGFNEDYIGQQFTLGIRAENLSENTSISDQSVEMEVEHTELMGAEVYLHLNYNGKKMIARVAPDTKAKAGDKISIEFNLNKMHLFDAKTGESSYL